MAAKKTSNPDDIEVRIQAIFVEQLNVDPEKLISEAIIQDDLGADSLDTVELIMAFEEEFGIKIPEEDAKKLSTVGEVINFVNKKLAKKDT